MSIITSVGLLANTDTGAPAPAPAGMMAALAIVRPPGETSTEALGRGRPAGQMDRKSNAPFSGTTATLTAYALTVLGIEQELACSGKSRCWRKLSPGAPKGAG